jgi:hypothetical protein
MSSEINKLACNDCAYKLAADESKRKRQELVFKIESEMKRNNVSCFSIKGGLHGRFFQFDSDGYLRYGSLKNNNEGMFATELSEAILKKALEHLNRLWRAFHPGTDDEQQQKII